MWSLRKKYINIVYILLHIFVFFIIRIFSFIIFVLFFVTFLSSFPYLLNSLSSLRHYLSFSFDFLHFCVVFIIHIFSFIIFVLFFSFIFFPRFLIFLIRPLHFVIFPFYLIFSLHPFHLHFLYYPFLPHLPPPFLLHLQFSVSSCFLFFVHKLLFLLDFNSISCLFSFLLPVFLHLSLYLPFIYQSPSSFSSSMSSTFHFYSSSSLFHF